MIKYYNGYKMEANFKLLHKFSIEIKQDICENLIKVGSQDFQRYHTEYKLIYSKLLYSPTNIWCKDNIKNNLFSGSLIGLSSGIFRNNVTQLCFTAWLKKSKKKHLRHKRHAENN